MREKERRDTLGGENESAPAANPKGASPSLCNFYTPVCANARQAQIEFDKKEIDSRASDSGVVRLLRWG